MSAHVRSGEREYSDSRHAPGALRPECTFAWRLLAILMLAVARSAVADAQQDPSPVLERYSVPVTTLVGRSIGNPELMAAPVFIFTLGQKLVVLDARADSAVLVIDGQSGKTVRSFGRRGDGPGEFRNLAYGERTGKTPNEFVLYDARLRRLTTIDLDQDFVNPRATPVRTRSLNTGHTLTGPMRINASEIATPGFLPEGRLGVFDNSGRLTRYLGAALSTEPRVPIEVSQHAYQSFATFRARLGRIAIVTRHADRLDIYSVSDGARVEGDRPFIFEPVFAVQQGDRGPVMASGETLRFGYVGVAATDEFVFALFSGRTRKGFPGRANFGDKVHVFDWNGRLLRVLKLPEDALSIAVSDGGDVIYTVHHEPLPGVSTYSLSKVNPMLHADLPGGMQQRPQRTR